MSFGLLGLLGLAFFVFAVFFIFKQIQFFFTAVDLYKGMNQRLDKVIELLSANPALLPNLDPIVQRVTATSSRGESTAAQGNVLATPTGPMGTCPNCSAVISLAAEDCPKCKATFGAGSAWTVQSR